MYPLPNETYETESTTSKMPALKITTTCLFRGFIRLISCLTKHCVYLIFVNFTNGVTDVEYIFLSYVIIPSFQSKINHYSAILSKLLGYF
jgi:hypothetical protein